MPSTPTSSAGGVVNLSRYDSSCSMVNTVGVGISMSIDMEHGDDASSMSFSDRDSQNVETGDADRAGDGDRAREGDRDRDGDRD